MRWLHFILDASEGEREREKWDIISMACESLGFELGL